MQQKQRALCRMDSYKNLPFGMRKCSQKAPSHKGVKISYFTQWCIHPSSMIVICVDLLALYYVLLRLCVIFMSSSSYSFVHTSTSDMQPKQVELFSTFIGGSSLWIRLSRYLPSVAEETYYIWVYRNNNIKMKIRETG